MALALLNGRIMLPAGLREQVERLRAQVAALQEPAPPF